MDCESADGYVRGWNGRVEGDLLWRISCVAYHLMGICIAMASLLGRSPFQVGRVDVYDGDALRAESVVHMDARYTLQ